MNDDRPHRPPSTANSPSSARPPALRLDKLLERIDGDRDLARDILQVFQEDAAQLLVSLQEAVTAGDPEKTRVTAHSLKGAAANASAETICEVASQIETAGKTGQMEQARNLLPELREEFERFTLAVRDLA